MNFIISPVILLLIIWDICKKKWTLDFFPLYRNRQHRVAEVPSIFPLC